MNIITTNAIEGFKILLTRLKFVSFFTIITGIIEVKAIIADEYATPMYPYFIAKYGVSPQVNTVHIIIK